MTREDLPGRSPEDAAQAEQDATLAQADANAKLRAAKAQGREVSAHGAYWRRERQRNHFTELLIQLVRSVRP